MSRHRFGHELHTMGAAPVVVRPPSTVTGQAAGLVNLAAKPIKWTFHTAGSLVRWVGGTLDAIGNKL